MANFDTPTHVVSENKSSKHILALALYLDFVQVPYIF